MVNPARFIITSSHLSIQSPVGLSGEAGMSAARPVKEVPGTGGDSVRMAMTALAPTS